MDSYSFVRVLFIWEWLLFRRDKNLDALNFAKTCHREIKVTLKFSMYTVYLLYVHYRVYTCYMYVYTGIECTHVHIVYVLAMYIAVG